MLTLSPDTLCTPKAPFARLASPGKLCPEMPGSRPLQRYLSQSRLKIPHRGLLSRFACPTSAHKRCQAQYEIEYSKRCQAQGEVGDYLAVVMEYSPRRIKDPPNSNDHCSDSPRKSTPHRTPNKGIK